MAGENKDVTIMQMMHGHFIYKNIIFMMSIMRHIIDADGSFDMLLASLRMVSIGKHRLVWLY